MTKQLKEEWDRAEPLEKDVAAESGRARQERVRPQAVVVVDLDISFDTLVKLMVKMALAAIPAAIILAVIFAIVSLAFTIAWSS